MKKILLLILAVCLSLNLISQVTYGPRLGLNISKYAYNWTDDWDEPQVKFKGGFSVAGLLNWQFNDFLALQPALSITKKGTAHDVDSWNSGLFVYTGYDRERVTYLELPVNIAGGIRLGPGQIQLFIGPYIAFAIAGKNRWDYEENDNGIRTDYKDSKKIKFKNKIEAGDHDDEDVAHYQRPLDYGVNAGLGYRYDQLLFNLGFAMGLANLQPDRELEGFDPVDYKYSNRTIFITVAWLFGQD
ncbi:MAG: porin family protein [Bacteroidales bacterium]|jgi:hypothetical protein|nr:porin family protein [Bacteroidales bacterium]